MMKGKGQHCFQLGITLPCELMSAAFAQEALLSTTQAVFNDFFIATMFAFHLIKDYHITWQK